MTEHSVIIQRETLDGEEIDPYIVGPYPNRTLAITAMNDEAGLIYCLLTIDAKSEGYVAGEVYVMPSTAVPAGTGIIPNEEDTMTPAQRTRAVYDAMTEASVSLSDLELIGFLDNLSQTDRRELGELTVPVEVAFNALVEQGFNLWDGGTGEHYYQATQEYVTDNVERLGLVLGEDHHYALHVGVVGGLLNESERREAEDKLRDSTCDAVVAVHQDGDNFHEWGERFDPDPADALGTVASRSAHLVLHVQKGTTPSLVFNGLKQVLPGRVFLTAAQINETSSDGYPGVTSPFVVTSIEDWSVQGEHLWPQR